MVHKPVIFISSTSDLRSARGLVADVLYSLGYEPVWQEVENTDGGHLLEVLRKRIEPCGLVVQLVGGRYGAEPPEPSVEFGRVSYTQYEALYAEGVGKKVIYCFLAAGFPVDAAEAEAADRAELQAAYVRRIEGAGALRQVNIATVGELELSIRRMRTSWRSFGGRGNGGIGGCCGWWGERRRRWWWWGR